MATHACDCASNETACENTAPMGGIWTERCECGPADGAAGPAVPGELPGCYLAGIGGGRKCLCPGCPGGSEAECALIEVDGMAAVWVPDGCNSCEAFHAGEAGCVRTPPGIVLPSHAEGEYVYDDHVFQGHGCFYVTPHECSCEVSEAECRASEAAVWTNQCGCDTDPAEREAAGGDVADDDEFCSEGWVPIVQGKFQSFAVPAVFNASLALDPYGALANDTATFDGATWFVPTDAAVQAFAAAQGLEVEDLLDEPTLETAAAVVWSHSCQPGTRPGDARDGKWTPEATGCEFTVDRFHVGNDLRDKVFGPCNSTAAVVDGPFKMCGGPTFYSIDAVLSTGPLCPEEGAAWEEAMAQVQD